MSGSSPNGCRAVGLVFSLAKAGHGKSRLALQLAVALSREDPEWIEHYDTHTAPNAPSSVVFASWEDEGDEIKRKIHGMETGFDRLIPGQIKDRLHFLEYSGKGSLWQASPDKPEGKETANQIYLRGYCEKCQAGLVIIDPLAAAYTSNENDRGMVRKFMSDWDAWARKTKCTVLIISHPAKSNYRIQSGSTDWHAASRFVWSLGLDLLAGEKKDGKMGTRLACLKSSYSRLPESIWLMGYPGWVKTNGESAAQWWESGGRNQGQEQMSPRGSR